MTPRFFENAPPTHSVPLALRISPRKGGGGWSTSAVLRNSSDRKRSEALLGLSTAECAKLRLCDDS